MQTMIQRDPVWQALKADVERIGQECVTIRRDPAYFPDAVDERCRERRQEGQDIFAGLHLPAWSDMVLDCVEVRYFTACRRLKLYEMGLDDLPNPVALTVKDQPERLGVLLIARFKDRLAAVDSSQVYDAMFTVDDAGGELYQAMSSPENSVRRWLKRREAAGNPWRKPADSEREASDPVKAEQEARWLQLVRAKKQAFGDWKSKRNLTRQEVHATLAALDAYIRGDGPCVEQRLRDLHLDDMRPVDALAVLRSLQAQAQKAGCMEFIPQELGGALWVPPDNPYGRQQDDGMLPDDLPPIRH